MSMINGEQLMCISWGRKLQVTTTTKLSKPLQLGQFKFHRTTPPTPQTIEDTRRGQGNKAGEHSLKWMIGQHMFLSIEDETARKLPYWQEEFYLHRLYIPSLTSIQKRAWIRENSFVLSSPFTFKSSTLPTYRRSWRTMEKKLLKPSYQESSTTKEKFMPGPRRHRFA